MLHILVSLGVAAHLLYPGTCLLFLRLASLLHTGIPRPHPQGFHPECVPILLSMCHLVVDRLWIIVVMLVPVGPLITLLGIALLLVPWSRVGFCLTGWIGHGRSLSCLPGWGLDLQVLRMAILLQTFLLVVLTWRISRKNICPQT